MRAPNMIPTTAPNAGASMGLIWKARAPLRNGAPVSSAMLLDAIVYAFPATVVTTPTPSVASV